MNHKNPTRSSSHARKPAARPLHKRGQSHNILPAQSHNATQPSRPILGGARRTVTEVTNQDEDTTEEMAGFLQFCATCETQIITPGVGLLYCSERCRRNDVSMPTPPPQMTPNTSYFEVRSDIVPQRSPTTLRPVSLTFSDLSISDIGQPTHQSHGSRDSGYSEQDRRFVEFHSNDHASQLVSTRRPQSNRASTAFDGGMPSLSNTPSSSIGTAASWSSYRPLPPRHDPSTGHYPHKSIDLVIPTFPTTAPSSPTELVRDSSLKSSASTMTSYRVAEAGNVSFARRRPSGRTGDQTSSSLKQLLEQQPPDS